MNHQQQIILGAGCFWGVQYFFDQLDGVIETEVGYCGGKTQHPTYEQVCYENTHHAEVCRVVFMDTKISLEDVLKYFFMMHDPTQVNRQGPDIGDQYRSVIFYADDSQREIAEAVVRTMQSDQPRPIATTIEPLMVFWPAEDYHQKFTERTGRGACHVLPSQLRI